MAAVRKRELSLQKASNDHFIKQNKENSTNMSTIIDICCEIRSKARPTMPWHFSIYYDMSKHGQIHYECMPLHIRFEVISIHAVWVLLWERTKEWVWWKGYLAASPRWTKTQRFVRRGRYQYKRSSSGSALSMSSTRQSSLLFHMVMVIIPSHRPICPLSQCRVSCLLLVAIMVSHRPAACQVLHCSQ